MFEESLTSGTILVGDDDRDLAMTIAAVILAAGEGSRFAGPIHKLLAEIDGRPIVATAVGAALEAGLDETIVVVGAVDLDAVLPAEVTIVRNPAWQTGQASSLQAAIRRADESGHDAVVVGLGDQPFVPAAAWRAVADCGAPVGVATFMGKRRPPVRLDRSVWPLLPIDGDEGARVLLRGRPDLVSEVACDGEPADVDTTEDLARWT